MRALLALALLLGGGCSQILGIDQFERPDGGGTPDGKLDAPSGPRLTGKIVNAKGMDLTITDDPGENVIWADLANGDPLDSTATNATGDFEVSLENGDMGQLKIGENLTYAMPGHVTSDAYVTAVVYDEAAFTKVLDTYQETAVPGDAHFFVIVEDADRQPVAGATVQIDPSNSTSAYADEDGLPEVGRTMTSTSGVIWFFNAVPNMTYTITASKSPTAYGTYGIMPVDNALVYAPLLPQP